MIITSISVKPRTRASLVRRPDKLERIDAAFDFLKN
ncbi:hypothetical protein J2X92_004756 [Variovorax paradoxus]|nr:hypothetical protein [Variovorax paradoxus]